MWLIAFYAAIAMVVQDILGVFMTQAEARNRATLSGLFDAIGYPAALITTTISVTAFQGHDFAEKAVVMIAVTAANFIGSYAGVWIGHRLIKDPEDEKREQQGLAKQTSRRWPVSRRTHR